MPTTTSLVDCLKLFNRKERYWLLRNSLGKGDHLNLYLDNDFLTKILGVSKIANTPSPQDVWWAMDYHLDWLAGALKHYGPDTTEEPESNFERSTISGTQEDIDFIISFDNCIILIEAKFDTAWNARQVKSKLCKINKLKERYRNLDIDIKFLLMSPVKPKWKNNEKLQNIEHVKLEIPDDDKFLKTVQCDEAGKIKRGEYWTIIPAYKSNFD